MKNLLKTSAFLLLMAFLGNEKSFAQKTKEFELTSKKGLKEFNEKSGKQVSRNLSDFYNPDSTVYQLMGIKFAWFGVRAQLKNDTLHVVQTTSRDYEIAPLNRLHVEENYISGPDVTGDGNLLDQSEMGNRHFTAQAFYEPTNGYSKRELEARDYDLYEVDYVKQGKVEKMSVKMEGREIIKDSGSTALKSYKDAVVLVLVDKLPVWRNRSAIGTGDDMQRSAEIEKDRQRMQEVLRRQRQSIIVAPH
jgi:hypothetical protein